MMFWPKRMGCSETRDTVQKGRTKSWWSTWGGMQSPLSYELTMAVSGRLPLGKTPSAMSRSTSALRHGGISPTCRSGLIPWV